MASEIATPAKDAAATETEVVSVDLPAPAGWKKKFTPKKGGTPKRNEISFISPTGEEITSKRQLEQYLRAHPGGPSSSEFDWGTGDTPRRSARLSAKAKATETPEGEKPMKRERKSSGGKGRKEKKDGEDGDTEAPEVADVAVADDAAAAAEEAKEEPADVEMKDAEGNVDKVKEDAGVEAEGEAHGELADTNEHVDGEPAEEAKEPAVEEAKEPADVEMKDAEGNVDKVKEDAGVEAEGESHDKTNEHVDGELAEKINVHVDGELADKTNEHVEEKKEGNQDKNEKNLENVDQTELVAPVVEEGKEEHGELVDTTNAHVDGELADKTNEHVEEKKEGNQDKNEKNLENVDQTELVAPVVEEGKETKKTNKEKEDSEMLPPNSEGKKDENAEENKMEGSDMLPPTSEGKENDNAEEEKMEGSDMLPPTSEEKPEVSAALPHTFEPPKEEASAEKESKYGDAPIENDGFKDNQDTAVAKETQHPVNCDDGQHKPRASPVNC